MPSAMDEITRNSALQEHWIRRLIAMVVDIILVLVIVILVAALLPPVLAWPWILQTFFFGVIWWLYAVGLEATVGGTVGKKLVAMRTVAIGAEMDAVRALIRNVSKIIWPALVVDFLVGFVTQGDPRQRYMDRIAGTTVTRVDHLAYMEEQFRVMQHVPPHPQPPPPGAYGATPAPPPGAAPAATPAPPPTAPPPSGWPQQTGGWPGQPPPQSTWPQHQWDEEGRLKPQMRFCTNCGGQLVARGDGRLTCVRCGAVY